VDFSHEFAQRAWEMSGSFSPSFVTGRSSALVATQRTSTRYYQRPRRRHTSTWTRARRPLFGYSTHFLLRKQAGLWRFETAGSAVSPGYEVNDLGFQSVADRIGHVRASLGYEQTRARAVLPQLERARRARARVELRR
jgi:hypothetical protein